MKIINNSSELNHYIELHAIQNCFDTDMKPHMQLVQYQRGEDILIAGDPMNYFYFIVDGNVKIINRLENGKSVLLRITRPLTELGSAEALDQNRLVNSCVQALHNVKAIRIPFEAIDRYASEDTAFYKYLVKRLSHKLTTMSNTASMNVSYPFKNRFASYLISIATLADKERIDEIDIQQKTDLATFLGTSYRHLNRVINELESDGLIKKSRNGFVILDYKGLEALSGGLYE